MPSWKISISYVTSGRSTAVIALKYWKIPFYCSLMTKAYYICSPGVVNE
jgi:hypothetical protein